MIVTSSRRVAAGALEEILRHVPHVSSGIGGHCAAGVPEAAGGLSPIAGEVAGVRPDRAGEAEYSGNFVFAKDLGVY